MRISVAGHLAKQNADRLAARPEMRQEYARLHSIR